MGKGKRKRTDDLSRYGGQSMAMGTIMHRVKRARSSSAESSTDTMADRNGGDVDNQGWQTVTSRKLRRGGSKQEQEQKKLRLESKWEGGPKVYSEKDHQNHQSIKLEDLRDLALYVLADGPGPDWVAVRGAKDIRAVVTIMVPGLPKRFLSRARELMRLDGKDQDVVRGNTESLGSQVAQDDVEHQTLGLSADLSNAGQQPVADQDSQVLPRAFVTQLLEELYTVKSPGDSWQMKVHSPLQALLLKPFDKINGKKQGLDNNDRSFQAVRTNLRDFIHTVDELRDAGYPIHPSLFTSQVDAAIEKTRRDAAGQSLKDGWLDSAVDSESPVVPPAHTDTRHEFVTEGLTIYAIDCEMVMTSDSKSSLARISIVSWQDGEVVMDKYVKPDLPILNYFTPYSGITEEILRDVTTTLRDIQDELKKLLTPSTIILGHSLESDLNAIKMTHPFIVDTSMIYPHPRGLPLRSSLKFLANKYLKREIQKGGANGHDSVEDARAVLDLVKQKCEKGPRWGTNEANGETMFKKVSRTLRPDGEARQSAMVEYGTPERGFGKDATFAIGCQDDDEIVRAVVRSAGGDINNQISTRGVDYIWARLRSLEYARGWVNYSASENLNTGTSNNTPQSATNKSSPNSNPPPPDRFETTRDFDKALVETVFRINEIRTSLPKDTLLILCNGTGDMREVMHYQNLQNQYRKEFKIKKWSEITVRWTDDEEQALKRAVDNARTGWGWIGVI